MANRVYLVDDNPALRRALQQVFEIAGFTICGEAADGDVAVKQAPAAKPDLIVLDLSMPKMNGLEAAPLLHQSLPQVPIILFTMHGRALVDGQAKAAGISAVISKEDSIAKLVDTANTLLAKS